MVKNHYLGDIKNRFLMVSRARKKNLSVHIFWFLTLDFSLFAHVHFGKDFRNPYQNGMVKNWKNPKSKIEKVFKKYFFYWLGILSGIDFWGPSDSDFLTILIFDFVFPPTFRPLHLVGISEILTKMDMCKKWKNLKSKIKKCVTTDFFYEPGIPSGIDFCCPPDSDFLTISHEIFFKKVHFFGSTWCIPVSSYSNPNELIMVSLGCAIYIWSFRTKMFISELVTAHSKRDLKISGINML